MVPATSGLLGVVSDDRPGMDRIVAALLVRCGFTVTTADTFGELLRTVAVTAPRVLVVALTVCGSLGVAGIGQLCRAAPGCVVVVLSSFASLEPAVREQGARALVDEDDLRPLEAVLVAVAAQSAVDTATQ